MSAEPDGRRRKGERRRLLLLDATMRLIGRDGVAAVTQRAVALEAGLPASAVLYYFPTVDDVLVAALTAGNDHYLQRLDVIEAGPPAELVSRLAALVAGQYVDRGQMLAENELYLLAARRPDMQAELVRWTAAVDALVAGHVDDPVDRLAVVAAIDGLFLRCACLPDPPGVDDVRAVLARLLGRA
ncbi:TetR/AcrR family transcriptional regulator [Pseudonocardia sp. GCM10023141]|uniref:TetR/AcrR family transcriptional regulator n=1 Tax=Pseudonocardia sp. GCM10023141 TaxID=3252653 RepID=UPI0036D42BAB